MIKDGMWFEDESHYRWYLHRTREVRKAFDKVQSDIFLPLIKRAKELLNEPS